jgi:hypothetical protein
MMRELSLGLGEAMMPKIELTYQQLLDAVKQLTPQEQQQLETDL